MLFLSVPPSISRWLRERHHHLRWQNNDMWCQDLPSPWKDHRARNRDSGEAGTTDRRQADVLVLFATGVDLGIRPSAPTSILPTSYNQEHNGMGTVLPRMTRLTYLHIVPGLTGPPFRRRSKRQPLVDYTGESNVPPPERKSSLWPTALLPLESVAGSLYAILEYSDVLSPLWHITLDAYSCSSKRWRVAKR